MMTLNPGVRAAWRKGERAGRATWGRAACATAPLEPHTPPSFFETTTLNRATVPSFGWLTTQAQRPGPQDAMIATGARWPGALQRMVGRLNHA